MKEFGIVTRKELVDPEPLCSCRAREPLTKEYLQKYYHDIKSPLRNISSFLQIIKLELDENHKNTEVLNCIDRAIDCLSVMDELNRSIFEDQGGEVRPVYLVKLLEKVQLCMSQQFFERNGSMWVDPRLPVVLGNSVDLLRIFSNLIDNSLKYVSDEQVEISVELKELSDTKAVLLFKDNGYRLPYPVEQEIREALAGNAKQHVGLSIIVELIEKNGGEIELLSSTDGCVFAVTLPVYRQADHMKSGGLF